MRQQLFDNAVELVQNRQYQQAVEELKTILEEDNQDDVHYQAMKVYADVLGPLAFKDYIGAVDIYQAVINETENDELYAQCQLAILNAYLNLSMEMMDAYEGMRDMIETEDDITQDYLRLMDDKRVDFLTSRAEAIYKKRL